MLFSVLPGYAKHSQMSFAETANTNGMQDWGSECTAVPGCAQHLQTSLAKKAKTDVVQCGFVNAACCETFSFKVYTNQKSPNVEKQNMLCSVGVVNAAYCETPAAELGWAGLEGQGMCSTGYGRTAGW